MTSLAEVEAKLRHPARLSSLAFGVGAIIAGSVIRDKAISSILIGAGVTASGITIASLFNPVNIGPLADNVQTRFERNVDSKAEGQSGTCWQNIPREEAPAEMMGATSMDEYLTGKPDITQKKYASEDCHAEQGPPGEVQTAYERTTGMALNQTGDPYVGPQYQNAVMGQGTPIADPRYSNYPNVETRDERSNGNIVGQSGTYREGQLYAHARIGSLAPPPGLAQEWMLPKMVIPLSGISQFNKIRLGQNYPGQAFGFRV